MMEKAGGPATSPAHQSTSTWHYPLEPGVSSTGHAHLSFCPCLYLYGEHTEAKGRGQPSQVPGELVQYGD